MDRIYPGKLKEGYLCGFGKLIDIKSNICYVTNFMNSYFYRKCIFEQIIYFIIMKFVINHYQLKVFRFINNADTPFI